MVRMAGLRDAASEACGTCPARLTPIKPRRGARHGSTRNDLTSRMGGSAGLGNPAGHDHQARR